VIGIIGPEDSVSRATWVAGDLGLADAILTRTYASWDDVPAIAAELDAACGVLLFTGRVPFTIARSNPDLHATLEFIPHDGADLYRALVVVLRERGGRLPTVSLDTIERSAVDETYRDLDIDPPAAVLSLDGPGLSQGQWHAADVTAFHVERYRRGEVELCLTCMGSVRSDLLRLGIPVVRIEHTRAALREALRRASLTDRLAQTEARQIAVALVEPQPDRRRVTSSSPYEAQRIELRRRQRVVDLAERLHGTLTDGAGGSFLIHTTRGAVEDEFARTHAEHAVGADAADALLIGFGVGATVASAEENARQAVAVGRHSREIQVVLDDGTILPLGATRAPPRYRLRETNPRLLAHARSLGLGSFTLARLVTALATIDHAAVSARDLAKAYGVTPRSALRLLAALERAGLAAPLGTRVAPRAGRPQTVYRVDLGRLLPPAAEIEGAS
jgi:DNA-binding transcriptional ArsR family regulator